MSDLAKYEELLSRLEAASTALPGELNEDWFSTDLFSCQSSDPIDYFIEIRTNIERLVAMRTDNDAYNWLSEKVASQLTAYTQALFRARSPTLAKTSGYSSKKRGLSAFHQELARHHEYERRLEENLREAQSAANSALQQEHVIRCQQRLIRCQRAIRGLEEKIRRAEG